MGRILTLIFLTLASFISMQAAQQLVLVDDRYQTALNTAIILKPYENDILHNSCQTTPPDIVQSPKNGKIEILEGTTLLRYTPEIGYKGNDTIGSILADNASVLNCGIKATLLFQPAKIGGCKCPK